MLIALATSPEVAVAAVAWPSNNSDWTALTQSSSGYVDSSDGNQDKSLDIRGSTSLSAGYYYFDDDQYLLMFRMRINKSPFDSQGKWESNVWQVLFDTDGTKSTIDWALQVDQSNSKTSQQVEFGTVTHGSPNTWIKLTVKDTAWSNSSLFRAVATGETAFDGKADYFIDMAIPYQVFANQTGLAIGDTFTVGLSTSQQSNNVNKDTPDGLNPNQGPFSDSVTFNPAAIPEPSSALLTGAGLAALWMLRRRKKGIRRRTAVERSPPPPSSTALR